MITRSGRKRASDKPTCQYGSSCYRKNPDHLAEFHHPTTEEEEEATAAAEAEAEAEAAAAAARAARKPRATRKSAASTPERFEWYPEWETIRGWFVELWERWISIPRCYRAIILLTIIGTINLLAYSNSNGINEMIKNCGSGDLSFTCLYHVNRCDLGYRPDGSISYGQGCFTVDWASVSGSCSLPTSGNSLHQACQQWAINRTEPLHCADICSLRGGDQQTFFDWFVFIEMLMIPLDLCIYPNLHRLFSFSGPLPPLMPISLWYGLVTIQEIVWLSCASIPTHENDWLTFTGFFVTLINFITFFGGWDMRGRSHGFWRQVGMVSLKVIMITLSLYALWSSEMGIFAAIFYMYSQTWWGYLGLNLIISHIMYSVEYYHITKC